MPEGLPATAEITIEGSVSEVWDALINPDKIKRYMFGAEVVSDWTVGSPIVWKGEWKGKPFQDKGRILEIQQGKRLRYSHFSPLSGQPDEPGNYHTLEWTLEDRGGTTRLTLAQDNNPTEEAAAHSKAMWDKLVADVKRIAEAR